jgi:hypothetical protein
MSSYDVISTSRMISAMPDLLWDRSLNQDCNQGRGGTNNTSVVLKYRGMVRISWTGESLDKTLYLTTTGTCLRSSPEAFLGHAP